MAEPDDVLRLEDICKSYNVGTPVEVEVLHDIDLKLTRGEFVALIGPSGSGKSTLLNIIGLLDRPTTGRLFIEGQRNQQAVRCRYHAAARPQHRLRVPVSLPDLGLHGAGERDDAAAGRSRFSRPGDARARATELLEQVGLARWEDNLANNMSGGQQQRVAIARALAMNPALMLADEPTGNLDTSLVRCGVRN